MKTYRVSKYDPGDEPYEDGGWTEVATGASLWGLRSILRELYKLGYDRDCSIAVDREQWLESEKGALLPGTPVLEGK